MEEKKYSVYIHINKINNKKYVGMTSDTPERRWGGNGIGYLKKKKDKDYQPAFAFAILKYGWDNFSHEIIDTNLTLEEASKLEVEKISEYQSDNPKYGYNIEKGGKYNQISESTREKMRESHRGTKHSSETKQKISQSNIGKTFSKEVKDHLSEVHSQKKGEPIQDIIPNYKYNEIPCKCVETEICYHSISTAARSVGSYSGNILKCITGERKRAGGYHWIKITEEEYEEYINNSL